MELYTYRFELDPTKDQRILLSKHCGATRFLYNHFLNQRENDLIVTETLNAKGMARNRKLAKHITDASFDEITRQLEYKSKWYGKIYIKIDQWFPSSKICNNCKEKNDNLTLNDREWECPQCASKLDRDINAAKNILNEGMKYLLNNRKGCQSAGTVDYTNGADVRPIITN